MREAHYFRYVPPLLTPLPVLCTRALSHFSLRTPPHVLHLVLIDSTRRRTSHRVSFAPTFWFGAVVGRSLTAATVLACILTLASVVDLSGASNSGVFKCAVEAGDQSIQKKDRECDKSKLGATWLAGVRQAHAAGGCRDTLSAEREGGELHGTVRAPLPGHRIWWRVDVAME